MSTIIEAAPQLIAGATLHVDTPGVGFTDITDNAVGFVAKAGAGEAFYYLPASHLGSLTIQEYAILTCRPILLPRSTGSRPRTHRGSTTSRPNDMPAHVKAMLNGVSLHVPVTAGKLALGAWQGIYLIEHRRKPHSREIILQFVGARM